MPNALNDDLRTRPFLRLFTFHIHSQTRITTSLLGKDFVKTSVDILNPQTLVENQIKDSREHAHTHHLGCHGRQNYRKFTDRHPSVSVVFATAIPEAFPGWREVPATDDYDGSPPSACVRSTVQPMVFWFTGTAFAQMEQTGHSLGACR